MTRRAAPTDPRIAVLPSNGSARTNGRTDPGLFHHGMLVRAARALSLGAKWTHDPDVPVTLRPPLPFSRSRQTAPHTITLRSAARLPARSERICRYPAPRYRSWFPLPSTTVAFLPHASRQIQSMMTGGVRGLPGTQPDGQRREASSRTRGSLQSRITGGSPPASQTVRARRSGCPQLKPESRSGAHRGGRWKPGCSRGKLGGPRPPDWGRSLG